MQGRLQGKRLSAEFFLADVVANHAEGCNYLLAVDIEMNTVDGYAMSSWEPGYGDFVLVPDLATLRLLPWHPGTALVLADVAWAGRRAGRRLAPADPQAPDRTGWRPAAGPPSPARSWSSSSSTTATSRPGPSTTTG